MPVAAGTAETMEASVLGWVNDARTRLGLGRLRADGRVTDLAGDRAAVLASKDRLSHDAAGCLSCQLSDRGIGWNLYGEILASNSWPWGGESARIVFESWRDSADHWDILMNPRMDAIGVGVALRSANGATYASAVLIDATGTIAAVTPRPAPASTPRPTPRPTVRPTPAPTPAPMPTPMPTPPAIAGPVARAGRIPL